MRRTSMLFVLVLSLVAASACSEGTSAGSAGTTTSSLPTEEPVPPGPVTIEVADTEVGEVLTDGEGEALYVYLLDDEAAIACTDTCRATWSPVLIDGKLSVAGGIDRAIFVRRELEDGTVQLAVGGQPLYRFAGDTEPGAVNGQGAEKLWYLLNPDGTRNTSLLTG